MKKLDRIQSVRPPTATAFQTAVPRAASTGLADTALSRSLNRQTAANTLQRKTPDVQSRPTPRETPAAPAPYRPQTLPKVLQRKTETAQPENSRRVMTARNAPPVYRPQTTPVVLLKRTALNSRQMQTKPEATTNSISKARPVIQRQSANQQVARPANSRSQTFTRQMPAAHQSRMPVVIRRNVIQRAPRLVAGANWDDPNIPGLQLTRVTQQEFAQHPDAGETPWNDAQPLGICLENFSNHLVYFEDGFYRTMSGDIWHPQRPGFDYTGAMQFLSDDDTCSILNIASIQYAGIGVKQNWKIANIEQAIRGGIKLPPIHVAQQGQGYVLINGRNRIEASVNCGYTRIPAIIVGVPANDELDK